MKLLPPDFSQIFAALEERADAQNERRRHARMTVTGRIQVSDLSVRREFHAMTRDLSFAGLSMIVAGALMPYTGAELVVALPHRPKRPFRARCRVVSGRDVADGLVCVGCEFIAFLEQAA
jgi:hypothetical protein